jgi:hypothetical protein
MKEFSFTVQCNNCGTERIVKIGQGRVHSDMDIFSMYSGDVAIECMECPNRVEVSKED